MKSHSDQYVCWSLEVHILTIWNFLDAILDRLVELKVIDLPHFIQVVALIVSVQLPNLSDDQRRGRRTADH
jgi:hypothetical protein